MEVRRSISGPAVRWSVIGELDDYSILHLESVVLNSQDSSKEVLLDLSEMEGLPSNGASSMAYMSSYLSKRGRRLEIVGANDMVKRTLVRTGLIEDQ